MTPPAPRLRWLGRVEYEPTWRAMQAFTDARAADTADEIWCLEHPPVFTQGMAGRPEHVLAPGDIPVVQIDRGGQVTYHGPGQLVVYPLVELRRLGLGIRTLVLALEQAAIDYAARFGIDRMHIALNGEGQGLRGVRMDDFAHGEPFQMRLAIG